MGLTELGERWHTDKGTAHSYLPIYEELLSPIKDEPVNLLEIGIGGGGSLGMWLEWMPNAKVTGLDLEIHVPPTFAHPRLRLLQGDQTDEQLLFNLRDERFDIIIDDGSHRSRDQLLTCHALWRCLNLGGYYFVEDIPAADRLPYWSMMPGYRGWECCKGGRADDILVMMRKA